MTRYPTTQILRRLGYRNSNDKRTGRMPRASGKRLRQVLQLNQLNNRNRLFQASTPFSVLVTFQNHRVYDSMFPCTAPLGEGLGTNGMSPSGDGVEREEDYGCDILPTGLEAGRCSSNEEIIHNG
jgi:hypothetical protein